MLLVFVVVVIVAMVVVVVVVVVGVSELLQGVSLMCPWATTLLYIVSLCVVFWSARVWSKMERSSPTVC